MPKHNHYRGGEAAKGFTTKPSPHHVMIASPSNKGFPPAFVMSIVASVETLVRFGIRFDFHILADDCHVDDARNKVFREFLETDCTHLMFIDSDMGWTAKGLMRVIRHPGDIVCGIYRHKQEPETYAFHPGDGDREVPADGVIEVPKGPTGFMRIKREVIAALHKFESDRGRFWWDGDGEDRATGKRPMAVICERAFNHELGLSVSVGDNADRHSGDLVLCLKARHLGFKVFADIEQTFTHVGEKEYVGHLGNHLRLQQNVDAPEFVKAVDLLKEMRLGGEETPMHVFDRINMHSTFPRSALPGSALMDCFNYVGTAEGDVVEFGSGISTLVMAIRLQGTDRMLHAVESDLEWFKRVGTWIERFQLTNVRLHYAPLVPLESGLDWYGIERSALPEKPEIVLIDGPERVKGQRHGVFEVMPDLLAAARVWIVDDINDPAQEAMLIQHGEGRRVEMLRGVSLNTEHFYAIAEKIAA